ncbi:MAG: hypothetical protein AAGH99_08045 [Planctomycetota bacterium]
MNASPPAPGSDTTQPAASPTERPGFSIGGPWVVAATLSLFVVVPVVAVVIGLLAPETVKNNKPFVWADRQTWPRTYYTAFKTLERGPMASARTNEKYKDLGFHVDPAEQLAMVRLTALAKQDAEAFFSEATHRELDAIVAEQPELFYAHYLLATWHRGNGRPVAAEYYNEQAFTNAPAVLMQHFVTPDGPSAANTPVPTLAFAADQIVDDRLDQSLVMVFPHLTTDDEGFIYMPVYKAILREEDPTLPPGVPNLQEKYSWFTFAGRVGRIPDETINTAPEDEGN